LTSAHLVRFADSIRSATLDEIKADPTLGGRLHLDGSGPLTISYAPFEHIQHGARVAIVGITPGAQQAANALGEARRRLLAGDGYPKVLAAAKVFASFSGPMRANLVAMLDHIGIARWLGITSTDQLWTTRSDLAHFTSALRYPVFVGGKNYTGAPLMTGTSMLLRLLNNCLAEEAAALPGAVWVPLGGAAEAGVQHLAGKGLIDPARVLTGLPHPSGANAERVAYFVGRKARETLSPKTSAAAIDQRKGGLLRLVAALP